MTRFTKWLFPAACFLSFFLAVTAVMAAQDQGEAMHANSDGNLVQVVTPYGSKLLFGDNGFGQYDSYRLEIPIKDFADASRGYPGLRGNSDGGSQPWQAQDEDSLVVKANELYNQGKFSDSMAFVEEILSRNPSNVRGWIMKGSLMHVMGNKDLAVKAWKRALELDPGNANIQRILEKAQ